MSHRTAGVRYLQQFESDLGKVAASVAAHPRWTPEQHFRSRRVQMAPAWVHLAEWAVWNRRPALSSMPHIELVYWVWMAHIWAGLDATSEAQVYGTKDKYPRRADLVLFQDGVAHEVTEIKPRVGGPGDLRRAIDQVNSYAADLGSDPVCCVAAGSLGVPVGLVDGVWVTTVESLIEDVLAMAAS